MTQRSRSPGPAMANCHRSVIRALSFYCFLILTIAKVSEASEGQRDSRSETTSDGAVLIVPSRYTASPIERNGATNTIRSRDGASKSTATPYARTVETMKGNSVDASPESSALPSVRNEATNIIGSGEVAFESNAPPNARTEDAKYDGSAEEALESSAPSSVENEAAKTNGSREGIFKNTDFSNARTEETENADLVEASPESRATSSVRNEAKSGNTSREEAPESTDPPNSKIEETKPVDSAEVSPESAAPPDVSNESTDTDDKEEVSPESTTIPIAKNEAKNKDHSGDGASESTAPSSAKKICGPKAISGRVHFRDWKAKLPWSTLSTGTSCKRVSFGSRPFPASQDVIILLTADRVDASDQPYHAPNVWGEAMNGKGFHVCVHVPDVEHENTAWTKDRVAVSWMALNRFSARKMDDYIDMYHAYMDFPDDSARCRKNMPKSLDADSQVLITTALNPGARFEESYIPHTSSKKVEDALTSWIQPPAEEGAQHEFCMSRPLRTTSKGLLGAKVSVLGFKRSKGMSGVTKLALMDGRACERVPISQKAAHEQNQIHLSVRVHKNDAVRTYKRGTTVTAWVTARDEDSFTVCAEGVGPEEGSRWTHNSVHISWISLPEPAPGGEQCQTVKRPAVRVASSFARAHG